MPVASETLSQKQQRFARLLGMLIDWAYRQPGYALTMGECYRNPEQAALNAAKGVGIAKSLHCERLAVDLSLFIDGVYQAASEAYEPLGVYWESIGGSWGGRFGDGNHFSLAHNGRK